MFPMRKALFCLAIFFCARAGAQTYMPLSLDTSCYWVLDVAYYEAGYMLTGEHTAVVRRDTIVNSVNYSEVNSYPSAAPSGWDVASYLPYYKQAIKIFLREDVVQRKVFSSYTPGGPETLLVDYGLQAGDSLRIYCYYNAAYVDSAVQKNINGILRRCQYGHRSPGGPIQTIEGVGAISNFPVSGFGEWCMPRYHLKCFSKGGVVLYGDAMQGCVRKSAWTSIESYSKQPVSYTYSDRQLRVVNSQQREVNVRVYDMTGKVFINESFTSATKTILLGDHPAGLMIVRLDCDGSNTIDKIVVE